MRPSGAHRKRTLARRHVSHARRQLSLALTRISSDLVQTAPALLAFVRRIAEMDLTRQPPGMLRRLSRIAARLVLRATGRRRP